jgi:hypothetical protein
VRLQFPFDTKFMLSEAFSLCHKSGWCKEMLTAKVLYLGTWQVSVHIKQASDDAKYKFSHAWEDHFMDSTK